MFLVLNLGLKSIRAIVFNAQGEKVRFSSKPLSTYLTDSYVEQDAKEWLEKGGAVIRDVLQESSIRNSIRYFTVTASSCCLVCVGGDGEPLNRVIMVSDKRAKLEALELESSSAFKGAKEGFPGLKSESSLMLPKILWVKKNEPDVFSKARYFLSPNDYFALKMTGSPVTDVLNAEKCYWSGAENSYIAPLFEEHGVRLETLPSVEPVGSDIGELTEECKSQLGIPTGQKVNFILSSYDAICAFYGSGVVESGDACDVSGTVTSLRALSNKSVEVDGSIFAQFDSTHKVHLVGGSNNLGGGLIEWAKQAFYSDVEYPYEVMEQESRRSSLGARGLIFLPYLMGERAPLWNDQAKGVFFGLTRSHSRLDFVRAVFESAGFSIRGILKNIEESGVNVTRILASGGLSRISHINRLKADILGKEIHVVNEFETTAVGAFILMGVSVGVFSDLKATKGVVRVAEVYYPDDRAVDEYSDLYNIYQSVYQNSLSSFELLDNFSQRQNYSRLEKIENM